MEEFSVGSGEGRGQGTSGILQGILFTPLPILYFQIVSAFVNTVHSVFIEHLLGWALLVAENLTIKAYFLSMESSWLTLTYYFEIILDFGKRLKDCTKGSHIPFTQLALC